MMTIKIGIIGFGNMGSAIARQAKGLFNITVFDKDKNKDSEGFVTASSAADLAQSCSLIVLSVKPQDIASVLYEIYQQIAGKLVISIAAGISSGFIKKRLGQARIIRIMPNMPAQIGEGISCICRPQPFNKEDYDLALRLFGALGEVVSIEENMVDAATAVSGSGPAFFCYYAGRDKTYMDIKKEEFAAELAQAAESIGFDKETSVKLSNATVNGTISLSLRQNLDCEDIIRKVASKGGTTEAGLAVLNRGGNLQEAVKAAYERARELS